MTAPLLDSQLTEERCDGAMDAERHTGCVLKTELFGWKWADRSPSGVRITLRICIYSHIFGQIRVKSSLSSLTQTFTHQISLTHTTPHMTVLSVHAVVQLLVWSEQWWQQHMRHKWDSSCFTLVTQARKNVQAYVVRHFIWWKLFGNVCKKKEFGVKLRKTVRLTHLHVLVFVLEVHEPMVGSDSLTELAQVYTHRDEILPDLPSLIITLERFLKGAERLLPTTHTHKKERSVCLAKLLLIEVACGCAVVLNSVWLHKK